MTAQMALINRKTRNIDLRYKKLVQKGISYLSNGLPNYLKALKYFQKAVNLKEPDEDLSMLISECEKKQSIREYFDDKLRFFSRLKSLGRHKEAFEVYKESIKLEPLLELNRQFDMVVDEDLETDTERINKQEMAQLVLEGEQAYREGDFEAALVLFQQVFDLSPVESIFRKIVSVYIVTEQWEELIPFVTTFFYEQPSFFKHFNHSRSALEKKIAKANRLLNDLHFIRTNLRDETKSKFLVKIEAIFGTFKKLMGDLI